MVGALSLVGSSVVDSSTCPCLCLDLLPSTTMSLKSTIASADLMVLHKASTRKRLFRVPGGSVHFSSSLEIPNRNRKKQRKSRSFSIVNELGGQYEDTFEDVKTQILNYFTVKAVRTVLHQLYELNPTQYRWFYDFIGSNKPGDGKRFIRNLGKEKHELAERVMITRLHLYGKWIKKFDHAAMYKEISDQNLELMRERLIETVVWPSDDTNTEKIG